jgi:hypothetical protein
MQTEYSNRSPSSPTKTRRLRRVSVEPTPVYKTLSKKWKIRNPTEEYIQRRRYSEPNPVPTLGKYPQYFKQYKNTFKFLMATNFNLEECLINFNLACQICAVEIPGQCRCSSSEPASRTTSPTSPLFMITSR